MADFITIANVPNEWNQQQELEHISKAEKKIKKVMEEGEASEEGKKGSSSSSSSSSKEKFEYAYPYVCVRTGKRWKRENIQSWYDHRRKCDYCLEIIERNAAEKQAYGDGVELMRGALSQLQAAKNTRDFIEQKILEEKKNKNENWEACIKFDLQPKLRQAEAQIYYWNKEKHKLLSSHNSNEITKMAAEQIHNKFLSASEKDRRSGEWRQP